MDRELKELMESLFGPPPKSRESIRTMHLSSLEGRLDNFRAARIKAEGEQSSMIYFMDRLVDDLQKYGLDGHPSFKAFATAFPGYKKEIEEFQARMKKVEAAFEVVLDAATAIDKRNYG